MTVRGRVRGGVVVLDRPTSLPEGAAVEVRLAAPTDDGLDGGDAQPAWVRKAMDLARRMPQDLPDDLAEQHDHYIHGTPKR